MKRKEYASVLVLLVVFLIIPFLDDNLSTAWKILLVSIAVFSAGWYGYEVFWNAKKIKQKNCLSNEELVIAYFNNELSLRQISQDVFNKKMGSKVYTFMLKQIKEMWQNDQLYLVKGGRPSTKETKRTFIPRFEKEITLGYLNSDLTLTKITFLMNQKPSSSRVYSTLLKTAKKMWYNKEIKLKN